MKPTTKVALAALVSALGAAFQAFAAEISGDEGTAAAPATPEPTTTRKKKGAAAAEQPATPAEPATPAADPEPETPVTGGKSYDELKVIIKPLVENNQGEDVKKVIAKYATNLKDLESKPQHHAAFEKDIAALSY